MPDLGMLAPTAVDIPPPELHEATILDDATAIGQEVRCVVPDLDLKLATDPMPWAPYTTATGVFYPKHGDRALLAYQVDGTPLIVWWKPNATEPDSVIGDVTHGIGMLIHGEDGTHARPSTFGHWVWVGTAKPDNAAEYDQWIKPN